MPNPHTFTGDPIMAPTTGVFIIVADGKKIKMVIR